MEKQKSSVFAVLICAWLYLPRLFWKLLQAPYSLFPGHTYLFTSCQSKFIVLSDTIRKLRTGLAEHTQIHLHTHQVEILPRTY